MTVRTDDFNRANEIPLAGNWTNIMFNPNKFELVSNKVDIPGTANNDAEAYWNPDTFGNDQFSEAAIASPNSLGGQSGMGVVVRTNGVNGGRTQYRLVADHAASNTMALAKFIGEAYTLLTQASFSWADGDHIRLEASGTSIVGKMAGTTQISVTDSSVTSGAVGISYSSDNFGDTIDDWSGGDLGGAPPTVMQARNGMVGQAVQRAATR